ncbi:nuclear transport factor 2 family protein [Streptomyces sp. SID3343]|uniref:nuclear transport factor 2 family protein n=1 Tax=Streptomyces sp. SID3343 TaxID=2690260 RepID=UPI001368385D|nr:nuclear transport factor 2 family protein [Streptomyces sp. SID3343]MYW00290.1 hypothetical protein [Streptomyces sp. SID3343]
MSNTELVAEFIRASEANQVQTALDLFAADGVWIDPAGKVYERDEIAPYLVEQIELLHTFHAQGTSVNYTQSVEVAEQDEARVYLSATVNQADGIEVRRFVDVFRIRDGKIVAKDVFAK